MIENSTLLECMIGGGVIGMVLGAVIFIVTEIAKVWREKKNN